MTKRGLLVLAFAVSSATYAQSDLGAIHKKNLDNPAQWRAELKAKCIAEYPRKFRTKSARTDFCEEHAFNIVDSAIIRDTARIQREAEEDSLNAAAQLTEDRINAAKFESGLERDRINSEFHSNMEQAKRNYRMGIPR